MISNLKEARMSAKKLNVAIGQKSVWGPPIYGCMEMKLAITYSARYCDFFEYIKEARDSQGLAMDSCFEKDFRDHEIEVEGVLSNVSDKQLEIEYYVGGKGCHDKTFIARYLFPIEENLYKACEKGFYDALVSLEDANIVLGKIGFCVYQGEDEYCPLCMDCPHMYKCS